MKTWKTILLAGGALLAFAAAAQAADLPTKKGAAAPEKPNCYATFWSWLDSSPKACPLSYWGVTFYGSIDIGGGYQTNASRFNPDAMTGVAELISKTSHGAAWQAVPNGTTQSNVGVKWREQVAADWFFIGDVNFGFDPYSLRFADGPRSLADNNTTPQILQSTNGDSSRTYGPINSRAYAGFQNKTFGTLTYGRQYAFSTDNDNAYDPFGGAYAFSLIGYSSTLGAGLGDTELARFNNSIKYVYADHNIRLGVLSQIGGWAAGNNAQYALQADVGFDYQGFSFDGVYSYAKDAVSLGTWGTASVPPTPETLKATVQNIQAGQVVGKYKWRQFTLYGGYQISSFTNPSDLPTGTFYRDFNGGYSAGWGSAIQGDAYPDAKILQTMWIGGKYGLLKNLDLIGGYYHVWQNDYLGSTETFAGPKASCAANVTSAGGGYAPQGTNSSKCAGAEDAISGMIDWKPVKRLDVYAGVMGSRVAGGMASGYFANTNIAYTGGLRLNF